MTKRALVYALCSFIYAGLFYLITKNYIYGSIVFILSMMFLFTFLESRRNTYLKRMKISYEAISFINNFIISLSVTNSILSTYESIKESSSEQLKLQMNSISHLNVEKRIEYLQNYFQLPIYSVFVNIINQYIESGTNILDISKLLIHDTRNLEDRLNDFEVKSKRKHNEFIISWSFTFLILVIIQFSLSSFVSNISEKMHTFPILVFVYFIGFIIVYYFYIFKIYDVDFMAQGGEIYEKNKKKTRKIRTKSKKRVSNSRNK